MLPNKFIWNCKIHGNERYSRELFRMSDQTINNCVFAYDIITRPVYKEWIAKLRRLGCTMGPHYRVTNQGTILDEYHQELSYKYMTDEFPYE